MTWLILATIAVVFVVGFRVMTSETRRAAQALTRRLNIEPLYVESLLNQMGKAAAGDFTRYIVQGGESHLGNAAAVLLIYQSFIINPSDESQTFWRGVLRKAHLPAELTQEHVRLTLTFLRELDVDAAELSQFRSQYNARFTVLETPADYPDNVYRIH
ncbi:DUF1198 family protein [Enterobacillus tribolii]|uniref:Uncharacterized protein DUF1198 n=1 Tax=Enterobacillus tribolii TaxID=1487935 RepID=A0A370QNT6_9GAMM|nr:DUF1198 family protein [Enterobacillus tribolii]MBW7982013.1 DUF1198 family protein [Enterobacillus tribolii]RDK89968.1 uncharacterized protein DUF1198 [Enterobacillus tribolii]